MRRWRFVFCRYSILANGTLIIRRVDDDDVGIYKCVGIGRAGPVQTYAAELLLACKSPSLPFRDDLMALASNSQREGSLPHNQ